MYNATKGGACWIVSSATVEVFAAIEDDEGISDGTAATSTHGLLDSEVIWLSK